MLKEITYTLGLLDNLEEIKDIEVFMKSNMHTDTTKIYKSLINLKAKSEALRVIFKGNVIAIAIIQERLLNKPISNMSLYLCVQGIYIAPNFKNQHLIKIILRLLIDLAYHRNYYALEYGESIIHDPDEPKKTATYRITKHAFSKLCF